MIKEYDVIDAEHGEINALISEVNEAIKKGWQPFGSMVISETHYYQSIVRII
jgi:hypothetical protein